MGLEQSLEELRVQHLDMRSCVHSMQLFAFDHLKSQVKFPASYAKHRSASIYKEDPGAKLCWMLLRYLKHSSYTIIFNNSLSPFLTIQKRLVAKTASRVSLKLLQKFSKSSSDWFGVLCKETKLQIFSPSFTAKVKHSLS